MGLHYNTYRFYDPVIGSFVQKDPIGLAAGSNLYSYAVNPLRWVDPLGLSRNECEYIYRALSADDRARIGQGEGLRPKGENGSIVRHVTGENTGYISVSESKPAIERFNSGNGIAKIDVKKATENGATYISHKNVMQSINARGSLTNRRDAKRAVEALFKGDVPPAAIEIIK